MEKGLAKSIEPFFEKVEKLSKIQRIAISAVLFGLITGAFIYFSYWPKFERINKLNADLEKIQKKLEIAKNEKEVITEMLCADTPKAKVTRILDVIIFMSITIESLIHIIEFRKC